MEKNIDLESFNELSKALSLENDSQKIKDFLNSILTENEVRDISMRWALVRLVEQGTPQRQISRELGLSLCKITRGAKELRKEPSPFARMIQVFKEGLHPSSSNPDIEL